MTRLWEEDRDYGDTVTIGTLPRVIFLHARRLP
jgi:hypothetical protein